MKKVRKVGINTASLLPWSIGPRGPALSVEIAQAAGFNGLQILPLRGWTRETMAGIPQDFVLSWERE